MRVEQRSIVIAGTGAPVGDPLNGDIAEVLAYASDKTASRTIIEDYLRAKYGL